MRVVGQVILHSAANQLFRCRFLLHRRHYHSGATKVQRIMEYVRKRKPDDEIKREHGESYKRTKMEFTLRQDAIVLMNGMPWVPDLFNFECARRNCGPMLSRLATHLWGTQLEELHYAQQMALVKHLLITACDRTLCDEKIIRVAFTVAPSSFVLINSVPVGTSPSQYNDLFLHQSTQGPVTKFTVLFPNKTILIDVVFACR
jgi:hypothetical protein